VNDLPNQQNNQQKGKSNANQQGSGSEYHREHAGNVPDYGGNTMDPTAEGLSNRTNKTE